jgi:hypothetical protein
VKMDEESVESIIEAVFKYLGVGLLVVVAYWAAKFYTILHRQEGVSSDSFWGHLKVYLLCLAVPGVIGLFAYDTGRKEVLQRYDLLALEVRDKKLLTLVQEKAKDRGLYYAVVAGIVLLIPSWYGVSRAYKISRPLLPFLSQASSTSQSPNTVIPSVAATTIAASTIVAGRYILCDNEGKFVSNLYVGEHGPILEIGEAHHEKVRVLLGMTRAGASLQLCNGNGDSRLVLSNHEHHSSMYMLDKNGVRVSVSIND